MTETERENRAQSPPATHLTEIRIRRAEPIDVSALADLASRTFREEFGSSLEPGDLALELQTRRSPEYFDKVLKTTTILVAHHRSDLVGYVQFGRVDIPEVRPDEGDRGLRRLYVDRRAQGRGLGRRLLEAALADPEMATAERVYLSVWDQNTQAGLAPVRKRRFQKVWPDDILDRRQRDR